MRFVARALGTEVQRAARAFAALIVTGPRRAGKMTLLRHVFPDASYLVSLQIEPLFDSIRDDPRLVDLVRRVGLP